MQSQSRAFQTKSKGVLEIKTFLLKGKIKKLASLQPQNFEISLACNFPKAPVETKYFNWEEETCPKQECYK